MAPGDNFTCAIRSDNKHLHGWGSDEHGQVSRAPKGVAFDSISTGSDHICGIRSDNKQVKCWGALSDFELPGKHTFNTVSAGDGITCGIRSADKSLICRGSIVYNPLLTR